MFNDRFVENFHEQTYSTHRKSICDLEMRKKIRKARNECKDKLLLYEKSFCFSFGKTIFERCGDKNKNNKHFLTNFLVTSWTEFLNESRSVWLIIESHRSTTCWKLFGNFYQPDKTSSSSSSMGRRGFHLIKRKMIDTKKMQVCSRRGWSGKSFNQSKAGTAATDVDGD